MSESRPAAPAKPRARVLLREAFERLRIPPRARGIALGVLVFLGVYIGVVALPVYVLQVLAANNIPVNLSQTSLMYYGGAMAVMAAAAYALRPYRAYGPASMGTGVAGLLYLFLLYSASPLSVNLGGTGGGAAIAVGYTLVVLILMIVTVFHLAADAVTTYEDFARPAERLYWTHPAR